MIGKLTGVLESKTGDGSIVVDVQGVGYLVRVPAYTLLTEAGARVSLYIHTAVREDAIDLFGFPTAEEHAFFKQLCSVSGVGPKTALGVLNVADVQSLKRSIAAGDATALTKVFGIGKKSAERIVVELRDKVGGKAAEAAGFGEGDVEVVEALMALGYRAEECRHALRSLPPDVRGVHERLSAALRHMGAPAK